MADKEYVQSEFKGLGESEFYRVKVMGDNGQTKWLRGTPAQIKAIQKILEDKTA